MAEHTERSISILDFHALIAAQTQIHTPLLDYAQLSDEDLIAVTILLRAWEREAAWKLYKLDDDLTYREARRSKGSIWRLLYDWKRNGVNGLAVLYVSNRQRGGTATLVSVGFITWLNVELNCIGDEIEKRVCKYPVGSALLDEVMRDAGFPDQQIFKLIQKESRTAGGRFSMRDIFKPYRDLVESESDRKQIAMSAFLEFRNGLTPSRETTPRPRLQLRIPTLPTKTDLPVERSKALEQLNRFYALEDIRNFRRDVLACLQGRAEKLTDRAYQRLRSSDRRWKKRKAKEVRSDEVGAIKLAEAEFNVSTERPTTQHRTEALDEVNKKFRAILLRSKASKRDKIREAFRLMYEEGMTEKEAARRTGITDRTINGIKLKLRSLE